MERGALGVARCHSDVDVADIAVGQLQHSSSLCCADAARVLLCVCSRVLCLWRNNHAPFCDPVRAAVAELLL